MTRHPIQQWSHVPIDRQRAFFVRFHSLAFVSLALFCMYVLVTLFAVLFALLLWGFVMLGLLVASFLFLQALCTVESLGIRFFGKRHGWRVTKDVAATVVGHASFAWVLSALGVGTVWGLFANGTLHQSNLLGPISTYFVAMFLAFIPGLLWFETLVWIGVRKLRYANIPGSERHLADWGAGAEQPADR